MFVLEDREAGRCVGTSLILAKTGRPEAPYYWLEVSLGGALEPGPPQALRAQEAPAALHRGRPHRGRRPDPRPGLPRPPAEVREGALDRALRVHLGAPRALRAPADRRDALALRRARAEPALGGLRRALHRPPLPRGGSSVGAHQAVHRRSLPRGPGLRDALPGGGAEGDRRVGREREGRRADPREDRLPAAEPGRSLRRRAVLRRGARRRRVGARAARAGAAGQAARRARSARRRRSRCSPPRCAAPSAPRWCRSTTKARRWSRPSAARRSASGAATA